MPPTMSFTQVQLLKTKQASFTDYFATDLVNLFNPIYDAHTLYRYPQGYGAANFVRPFAIESVYVNNSQQFYLRQGPMGDEVR